MAIRFLDGMGISINRFIVGAGNDHISFPVLCHFGKAVVTC